MADLLRMPEVAANTTDAVLASWPIPVNTPYRAKETIAVVETAKAAADIEAEQDGVLLATLVPEGAEVSVGAPIALVGAPGEVVDDVVAALAALGAEPVPAADRAPAPPVPAPPVPAASPRGAPRIFVSPLARRLARNAGLDVGTIAGSGPNGRIVRRDVEAAAENMAAAENVAAVSAPDLDGVTDVPHTRLRRAVAARLSASKQDAPHFYLRGSARVDALLRLRSDINDVAPRRVSINDLVVKAAALAHQQVAEMNVIWTADSTRHFSTVDIAVAVASDAGLVTPVLHGVEAMSLSAIADRSAELAGRARRGELKQHELEGGTITVTNLGMYGTEEFTAIINPPQAAILAVGSVRQEPVANDGHVDVAAVMRFTLSVDHRPVDGVTAARWMQAFVAALERPVQLVL